MQTFTTDTSGQLNTSGPFFQSLGTNGRICATCHQQNDGWSISAADVQARFTQAQSSPLRGLASRAPYFHNGSALTLSDVVNFYDKRFSIGFTTQEKADLVAFLSSL